MHFVYILKSNLHKKSYVGMTENVERRLSEHNAGDQFYTSRYKPWSIVRVEEYGTRELARKREKYLKSVAGRKFLKNVVFI